MLLQPGVGEDGWSLTNGRLSPTLVLRGYETSEDIKWRFQHKWLMTSGETTCKHSCAVCEMKPTKESPDTGRVRAKRRNRPQATKWTWPAPPPQSTPTPISSIGRRTACA